MQRIGIIGGSGLYQIDQLENIQEHEVQTPWGAPSDLVIEGRLGNSSLLFLPRHGRQHRIPPHQINYRANIAAMKQLGADALLSISAVGSLREQIRPGHFVAVDQFIDFTRSGRPSTFFDTGVVAHVSMADPVCNDLRQRLIGIARQLDIQIHDSGTYICMEGPQFSSRAESEMYRSWGADVVGMTNMPEAKLAREAGLCYSTLALSTDYDCWKTDEEHVSTAMVIQTMHRNVENARRLIVELASRPISDCQCGCATAAAQSIITSDDQRDPAQCQRLKSLYPELPC